MVKRDSTSRKIFNFINVFFLVLLMASVLFPYLNVLAKSFNDGNDTMRGGITIYPREFSLQNYDAILGDDAFGRAFIVSVCSVVLGTLLSILVQFMAAYVFLHKDMFGSKLLYVFLIIPIYFGGGIVPTYILYSQIGLINNYMVYFLPGCFSFYNMIIIRSYMSSLPYSLHEAAKIDGANDLCVFFKIILPLAKPILATIALWTAVGIWSDWTTPLYYITKSKMYNLQYLLVQVLKEAEKVSQLITQAALRGEIIETKNTTITTEGVKCAQMIVSTIPIVIIYPFLQKYFIQGVTLGAVKD